MIQIWNDRAECCALYVGWIDQKKIADDYKALWKK